MQHGLRNAPHAAPRLPLQRWSGRLACVWVAALFALGADEAVAAALGSLPASVGVFAALATVFVAQAWPAQLPGGALSTAVGMLLVAAAAAGLWRALGAARLSSPSGPSGLVGPIDSPAPAQRDAEPRASARPGQRAVVELPAGIERAPLLAELRLHFVRLQAAWDLREMATLRALTTAEMLEELCFEWPGEVAGQGVNCTDVVTLHAELLGFELVGGTSLASVEFSGLIREAPEQGAVPFREVWMLAKAGQDAAGWRLAWHQALF